MTNAATERDEDRRHDRIADRAGTAAAARAAAGADGRWRRRPARRTARSPARTCSVSASKLRLITSAIPSTAASRIATYGVWKRGWTFAHRSKEQPVVGHREEHAGRRQHAAVQRAERGNHHEHRDQDDARSGRTAPSWCRRRPAATRRWRSRNRNHVEVGDVGQHVDAR